MIAANEAVARAAVARGVPCLYRVHERPEPERVERLVDQLASLEVPTPPVPERMSASQAAELVGEISQPIERHVRRTGRGRRALGALLLRSLKQAYYSPAQPRPRGPAAPRPTATSPRRSAATRTSCATARCCPRSAPTSTHRARPGSDELGAWTSEREREAMSIERDADDIARCFVLERVLARAGREQRLRRAR